MMDTLQGYRVECHSCKKYLGHLNGLTHSGTVHRAKLECLCGQTTTVTYNKAILEDGFDWTPITISPEDRP